MPKQFERTQFFSATKEVLYKNCITTVNECRFKVVFEDSGRGVIVARSGPNLKGIGKSIMIVVKQGYVAMKCECSSQNVLFDWGRNKRNVDRFFEKLWNKPNS